MEGLGSSRVCAGEVRSQLSTAVSPKAGTEAYGQPWLLLHLRAAIGTALYSAAHQSSASADSQSNIHCLLPRGRARSQATCSYWQEAGCCRSLVKSQGSSQLEGLSRASAADQQGPMLPGHGSWLQTGFNCFSQAGVENTFPNLGQVGTIWAEQLWGRTRDLVMP